MSKATESTTTRRTILAALGVAMPSAAIPAALTPRVTENPELIAWGEKIEGLESAYREAAARKEEALERYYALCPRPEALVATPEERRLGFDYETQERD